MTPLAGLHYAHHACHQSIADGPAHCHDPGEATVAVEAADPTESGQLPRAKDLAYYRRRQTSVPITYDRASRSL